MKITLFHFDDDDLYYRIKEFSIRSNISLKEIYSQSIKLGFEKYLEEYFKED